MPLKLGQQGERLSPRVRPRTRTQAEVGIGRKAERDGGLLGEGTAWTVSVSQTFKYSDRIALRKAIANKQLKIAELKFSQFRAALSVKARSLRYSLLIAQQRAEAARNVSARGRELVNVLVQRDPGGIAPLLETRIIEASIITLQREAKRGLKEFPISPLCT